MSLDTPAETTKASPPVEHRPPSGAIALRPVSGNVRPSEDLRAIQGKVVVWWFGGIVQNRRDESVPKVAVFLRTLDKDNVPRAWQQISVALTHLGILRIGTVWQNGVCIGKAEQDDLRAEIEFTPGEWSFTSPDECLYKGEPSPLSGSDYPLRYQRDRNWLISFRLPNGGNLLVPCIEFLTRCYGRSQEVPRILTTYRWEEAANRFFAPFDATAVEPGYWPIRLRKRLHNGDTVFLAHALHDDFARNAAKSIFTQISTAFNRGDSYAFPKIGPWFSGTATIKVRGHWINNGRTFLALRVDGLTEPSGIPLQRDRENSNKVENPATGSGIGEAWKGAPGRHIVRPPEIVDLTDANAPRFGAASTDVVEDDFEVLGEKRAVKDYRRYQAETSAGKRSDGRNPDSFSSGEVRGAGTDTGHASIHAHVAMESEGTLRDMWNALRKLPTSHPDQVRSVEWYTHENGFRSSEPPQLVALTPFDKDDKDITTKKRNWLFFDVEHRLPRGILVARVVSPKKVIYIVEIQRRPRIAKGDDGTETGAEESFQGLVFELHDELTFLDWLNYLLSEIRHVVGIVKNLTAPCPGNAFSFRHVRSGDKHPGQAAVRNALEKLDIKV